jgi:hypothetical protein
LEGVSLARFVDGKPAALTSGFSESIDALFEPHDAIAIEEGLINE